jgi:hypothetical protein
MRRSKHKFELLPILNGTRVRGKQEAIWTQILRS